MTKVSKEQSFTLTRLRLDLPQTAMKGNLSASKDGNTKAKVLSVFDEFGSWMHLILVQLSNKNMQGVG